MSTSGETADLMVKEGIQITESAVKLAGLGAKNLAALLIALANDNQKLAGKTNLKRLIHDGEELTIFSVKKEDLAGFHGEAKRYGVLYYPIVNKVENTGMVEIMAKAKDAKQINRIFERMGYPAPTQEEASAKKQRPAIRPTTAPGSAGLVRKHLRSRIRRRVSCVHPSRVSWRRSRLRAKPRIRPRPFRKWLRQRSTKPKKQDD